MKLGYDMRIEQSQKLVMTPDLIQAIQLLAFNTEELDAYLQEQSLSNPVLELSSRGSEGGGETQEGDASESVSAAEYDDRRQVKEKDATDWSEQIERLRDCGKDDISYRVWEQSKDETPYSFESFSANEVTLKDMLLGQLRMAKVSEDDRELAVYIIEAIDDNGYLTVSTEELARIFNVPRAVVKRVLDIIQTFDPAGVGARDLSECLRIQLRAMGAYNGIYERLISEFILDIADNKLSGIAKQLDISVKELQGMSDVIKGLEPKPGRQFASSKETRYIFPDIIVEKQNDEYAVSLNDNSVPMLKINSYYSNLLEQSKHDKELEEYLKDKVNSALWLIKSIEQRNRTIINVTKAVVDHQREFFERGAKFLKPLTLKQIAQETGVHESTVSRCVNGKYLQSKAGVYELKFFFSGGLRGADGEAVASHNIKLRIKEIIDGEDPKAPLSDQSIAELLTAEGVDISRRTVAKYRDELKIQASSKRRRF